MKNILCILACFVLVDLAAQQTPQTSFFNENRASWNPAYTGHNKLMSINGYIRQQWLGFGASAPRTLMVDYQHPFVDYNMAVSGGLLYDQTGPVSKRGVNANYAYSLSDLGDSDAVFSIGLSAGAIQYVYNPNNEVTEKEGDPLVANGNQTSFFPSISGGAFLLSSTQTYRQNTSFYVGISFLQAYESNVLVAGLNQKRTSHVVFDIGSRIYGYDYYVEPSFSVNFSNPEIIDVLAGATFHMRDAFWVGIGYSSVKELAVQGGYVLDDFNGRDTQLKIGVLGNIGITNAKVNNLGPGAELFIRYQLDMD